MVFVPWSSPNQTPIQYRALRQRIEEDLHISCEQGYNVYGSQECHVQFESPNAITCYHWFTNSQTK